MGFDSILSSRGLLGQAPSGGRRSPTMDNGPIWPRRETSRRGAKEKASLVRAGQVVEASLTV